MYRIGYIYPNEKKEKTLILNDKISSEFDSKSLFDKNRIKRRKAS